MWYPLLRHIRTAAPSCLVALACVGLLSDSWRRHDASAGISASDEVMLFQTAVAVSRHQPLQSSNSSQIALVDPDDILNVVAQTGQAGSDVLQSQLGVTTNSGNDVETLLTSLSVNIAIVIVYLLAFYVFQRWQPKVYLYNTLGEQLEKWAPNPRNSCWGLRLSTEDVEEHAGLDSAMFVEFCNLGMKVSACLGLPLCLLLCPTYFLVGNKFLRESSEKQDFLFKISMSALQPDSWAQWVVSVAVWITVWAIQKLLFAAQMSFATRRLKWLGNSPKPQASTLMVSNIPRKLPVSTSSNEQALSLPSRDGSSDKDIPMIGKTRKVPLSQQTLQKYFEDLFPDGAIERVYLIRHVDQLAKLIESVDAVEQRLHESLHTCKEANHDEDEAPDKLRFEYNKQQSHIEELRKEAAAESDSDKFPWGQVAFVTFQQRRDAEMALQLRFEPTPEIFTMEYAPSPVDVNYHALLREPLKRKLLHVVAYSCIFCVFWFFFPIIGMLSAIINLDNLRTIGFIDQILNQWNFLEQIVEGVFASLVLSLFMGFLPTLLRAIIVNTFSLKSETLSQRYLQQWYFWFQIVFVLLVTAIGTSLLTTLAAVLESPKDVLFLLAGALPGTSTFYMNYIVLQWATNVLNITRYVNLLKFLGWRAVCDEDRAKAMSEPEDADFNGIGSRSARLTLILVVGIVFSALAPLVLVITLVFFFICRWVYTYLMVFAETRKPDLGGEFWCLQLQHVQLCIPIYIFTMGGCLWSSSYATIGPGTVASSSFLLWAHSYSYFNQILWETLPFRGVVESEIKRENESAEKQEQRQLDTQPEVYIQPELRSSSSIESRQQILFAKGRGKGHFGKGKAKHATTSNASVLKQ